MDPFTQRMLERAKARREKLDTKLSNAGHNIQPRRSPLKDANAISALQASIVSETKKSHRERTRESSESSSNVIKTVSKVSEEINKRDVTPDKENGANHPKNVKSKLQRLGKLYSDDSHELSSPIHRTEEKFSAEDESSESKHPKRGARLDRLAALASEINNWEDDLSHPTLLKKGESKAEKIQAKMNEQVKAAADPQPSTSGYGKWKSNANSRKTESPPRQIKWDKTVLENLEAQGYTRTKSNSRLVYDYNACSQGKEGSPKRDIQTKRTTGVSSAGGKITSPSTKASGSPSARTPETSKGINNGRSRFGGYNGSPKSTVQSPGSVLSKASLFESKSLANKVKDPAEMTLSERLALFEKNKGEALIPKAPLTLSVPAKKLMEKEKSTSNVHSAVSDQSNRHGAGKTAFANRHIFEQGLPKQEMENDILRDSQAERKKELEMLRSRFNKNKEVAQAAAGSCIRKNSESNTSPKNSPVCPVKPTPATVNHASRDHVPPAPPLPSPKTTPISTRQLPPKRQVATTPPQSHPVPHPYNPIFSAIKRIKVSPPKPGHLYPDLTNLESSSPDTTDTEYTLGTTEPETATLDEEDSSQEDDSPYDGNTSFETSILRAVTTQNSTKKRTIESDLESTSSDISVLEEMDEYLDECLAIQDSNHGPTPPKQNRATGSPSMTSNSFKYTTGSAVRSPLKITPSPKRPVPSAHDQYIEEGDSKLPLMHSVSFYRRQQSQTPKTPVRTVSRIPQDTEEFNPSKHESLLVQDKLKRLKDEVCKQNTIIGQSSQALNLCNATVEFSGSREQVEGERLLLVATHRRQAAHNEIQRLKVEGTVRPSVPGACEVQESGSLTISAITLPLKKEQLRSLDADVRLHYLCLVRHLDTVIATQVVQAEPGDSCVRFPSTLKLENLYSDFTINVEVYSLETRAEILPHEVKYHIHGGHCGGVKKGIKTPKKFLKQESRLMMPSVQSPAGPNAVRSPAFSLSGYVVFSLKEVSRQQFTLNKVPRNSVLEGKLQMHVECELEVSVEHRGFLTMFEDVSGFGAWHRRWCLLKGDTLSYWKYPDDERKKTPIGSLELQGVSTASVGVVSRDICARPHTFLLETVREAQHGDVESLTVVRNGSLTTIRHLISADTKEERLEWCSKLNQTLSLIRAWGGTSSALS